jgi:steroid 5-alpha reductase family enzyme
MKSAIGSIPAIFLLLLGVPLASAFTHVQELPSPVALSKNAFHHGPWPSTGRDKKHQTRRHDNSVVQLQAFLAPQVWTSLLPPCLGFYKSEYTVSLGYGSAVALTAATLLRQAHAPVTTMSLVIWHGASLIFYGLRLNAFLILRNVLSQRIQEFNTKVEERAIARGNRWTTRAPFILSCGLLYYGLTVPLWFHTQLTTASTTLAIPPLTRLVLQGLIAAQWFGFGIAAIGDATKFHVKQSQKNERYLVTSGIYAWWRHPNYSGEVIGWTANALLGLVTATLWMRQFTLTNILNLASLVLGWTGITFVLLRATESLEARQKKEYGNLPQYQSWIQSTWGGWQLPANTKKSNPSNDQATTPHLELDEVSQEERGSGI